MREKFQNKSSTSHNFNTLPLSSKSILRSTQNIWYKNLQKLSILFNRNKFEGQKKGGTYYECHKEFSSLFVNIHIKLLVHLLYCQFFFAIFHHYNIFINWTHTHTFDHKRCWFKYVLTYLKNRSSAAVKFRWVSVLCRPYLLLWEIFQLAFSFPGYFKILRN